MGVEAPWSKGPTMKFLDSTRRYDVVYRYRMPGEHIWTQSKIGITARSPKHCEERVIRFISQKWRAEVDVMKVTMVSDEMPIQTGEPVETVSEKEYISRTQTALEKTEEERKELLREKGMWIP